MSRRQTDHSSFRFKSGRGTSRRNHQDSRLQYDDRKQDTRFDNREFSEQDHYGVDRHGEYHRAILREDFNDPQIDDADQYTEERYNIDGFVDRNQIGAYAESDSSRFQDNLVADERYFDDSYDQNNSYQEDLYTGNNDQYDRLDRQDTFDDGHYGDDQRLNYDQNYDQDNYYLNQRYSDNLNDDNRDIGLPDSSRNEDYRYEERSDYKSRDQRNYKNDRRLNRGSDKKRDGATFQKPKPRTVSSERQHKHVATKERSKSQDDRSSHTRKSSSCSARHGHYKTHSKERDSKRSSHSGSDARNKSNHKSDSTVSKGKHQISKNSSKQTSHSSKLKDSKHGKPSHVSSSKADQKESLNKGNTRRKHSSSEKGESTDARAKDPKKNSARVTNSRSNNKSGVVNRSPQKKSFSETPTRKRTVSNENKNKVDSGKEHMERSSMSRSAFDVRSDHSRQRSAGRSGEVVQREEEARHHDDDILSIFADDDRFYWETNTLLEDVDNMNRNEGQKNHRDQKEDRQYYQDEYSNIDNREQFDDNTRLRSAVGNHSHRNRDFSNNANFKNRGKFWQNRTGFYKKKKVIDLKQNLSMNKFAYRGPRGQNYAKGGQSQHNNARASYNDDGRHNEFNIRNNEKGKFSDKSGRFSNKYKNLRGGGHKEQYVSNRSYSNKNDGQNNKNYDHRAVRNTDNPNYNDASENHSYDESQFENANKNQSHYREEQLNYNEDYHNNDRENMNVNETGQQIIFIPNSDFHGNIDTYGNTVNPDLGDNQGKIQQMPMHMLPQNMVPEGAQGSEQLIFIPFVNNQLQPDSAVPVQLNNEGQMVPTQIQPLGQDINKPENENLTESKGQSKKPAKKGLSNEKRALMRKKLILKRRQSLEQEIEQKVLKKLLGTAGKLNLADPSTHVKKPLKRLSPPKKNIPSKKVVKKATSGLEDVSDDEVDKYDDISDLESISEDEDLTKQKGMLRKSFRKPGEPRVNQKSSVQNVDDVRRVVEKNVSQKVREVKEKASEKVSRGRKRTVYEVHDDDIKDKKKAVKTDGKKPERPGMSSKLSKGRRSMSPLQITVNNEKFSSASRRPKSKSSSSRDEEDEIQNRRKRRDGSRDRNMKKRSRDYDEDDDDEFSDDYSDEDDDDFDNRDRGRHRSNRSNGKYSTKAGRHENDRDSNRKDNYRDNRRRASSRDDIRSSRRYQNDRRDNRSSPPRWRDSRNKNYMSQNKTNDNVQNYRFVAGSSIQQQNQTIQASPYASQLLTSQSMPIQSNVSLVNTGNSVDPSLPPVLNVPQLSQSNVGMHPDMSLPPPQVSVMGNQSSLPQLSYQQSIQTQPLQSQVMQQNQQLQQATLQQLQQTQFQQQQTQQQQQLLQLQQQQQQHQVILNSNNQLNSSTVLNQGIYQQPTQPNSSATTPYSAANQQTNLQTIRPIQSAQQSVNSQGNIVQVQNPQLNQSSLTTQLQSSRYSKDMSPVTQHTARPQQSQYKTVSGVIRTISKGSNVQQQTMPQVNIPVAAIQPKPLFPTAVTQSTGRIVGAQFKGESFVGNDSNTFRSRTGYEHSQVNRSPMISSQSSNYSNRASSSVNHKQSDDRSISNRSSTYDRRGGDTHSRDTTVRSSQASRPSTSYRRDAESESDDDDVGQLMCMKCDKVYLSKKVMRKHARWHDKVAAGQHDVRCDKCELAFLTTNVLDAHVAEKHTIDSWNCTLCDVTFSHSSSLVRHFQRENHAYLSEKKYCCPICSNQFATVKMLSHHKQSHQIVKNTTRRY